MRLSSGHPIDIQREREQAIQLLADRTTKQKELLFRLSIFSGFFRRDHAVSIGDNINPPITHGGEVFDSLVGPWIERVGENYFRISPLLVGSAKEIWTDQKVQSIQVSTAQLIIKCGKLSPLEASEAFFLAFLGRSAETVLNIIVGLKNTPKEFKKSIAYNLSWLIPFSPDNIKAFFPDNRFVHFLLGLFQFQIAAEIEPETAPQLVEVLIQELIPFEPRKAYLIQRLLFAMEVLIKIEVKISPKRLIPLIIEIGQIGEELEEFREFFLHFSPPEGFFIPESSRDILSILFLPR